MPEKADDTKRGGLPDPDEAEKILMDCAAMATAGGNAARVDNPDKTDTKLTDSQTGKVEDSAYSSAIKPHITKPVLDSRWFSMIREKDKQTEEEDGAERDKSIGTAKEGDGSR